MSPGGVSRQVLQEVLSRGFEFFPDEAQLEEPAPEGVGGVVRLEAAGARACRGQGLVADGQAKLDVALYLPGVKCAVEGPELDGVCGPSDFRTVCPSLAETV